MGSVAASGGYYISAPADLIIANPGTITGSIGVIMVVPNLKGLLDKVGIKTEVVKERKAQGPRFGLQGHRGLRSARSSRA